MGKQKDAAFHLRVFRAASDHSVVPLATIKKNLALNYFLNLLF